MRAWVARDKSGSVYLFNEKPEKVWWNNTWNDEHDKWFEIKDSDLPEGIDPKWEDDEPIEVELKIEKGGEV